MKFLCHSQLGMVITDAEDVEEAAQTAALHLPFGESETLDLLVYELGVDCQEVTVRRSFEVEGGLGRTVH